MSDADCTPGREPGSVAASLFILFFAISVLVCLFVCLSVCLLAWLKNTLQYFTTFFVRVTPDRSFTDDNGTRYVLPVLWMTSYFLTCRVACSVGNIDVTAPC